MEMSQADHVWVIQATNQQFLPCHNMKEKMYTYFRLLAGGSLISFCIRILIRSAGVPMNPPIIPPTDAIPIFSQKDTFSPGLAINSLAACEQEWTI
jgi:hypothetical protein